MQLPTILMLCITITTGLVGLVFLLFPDRIARLEERLNAPWGDREVTALRLGLQGEQDIEQAKTAMSWTSTSPGMAGQGGIRALSAWPCAWSR